MTITGTVYNRAGNVGLTGVRVDLTDSGGALLDNAVHALTDSDGNFTITSPDLDLGAFLLFTLPGFQSVLIDPVDFNKTGEIRLDVTTKGSGALPYVLGGLGLAAAIMLAVRASNKKKAAVGKASEYILPLIIGGGVIAGGVILYKKLAPGPAGTSANNQVADQATAAAAAADLAKAQADAAAAGKSTQVNLSDSTISSLANTLNQELQAIISYTQTPTPDQLVAIRNNVISVNTPVDWFNLVKTFGTRKFNTGGNFSVCSWTGYNCDSLDLGTALKMVLDTDNLSTIDSFFSAQGIPVVL